MTDLPPFKKLLLHACCGPCAVWPLEVLLEEGVQVSLLFYNPNIHPGVEWQRRLENTMKVAEHYGVPLLIRGCSLAGEWIRRADEGEERCRYCYEIRLTCVAKEAVENGFDAISSTLLVSPYQKRDMILEEGRKAAEEKGLTFIPYDWREGFRRGQAKARELGLYRQKYCGCLVSLAESSWQESILSEQEELALWECLKSDQGFQETLLYDPETWEEVKGGG